MRVRLEGGLPYVAVTVAYLGREITLENVIVDTGSAACVFSVDELSAFGVLPEPGDPIRRVHGVGGSAYVFSKRMEKLALGNIAAHDFEVQIGAMDYGFALQGILGMDFLLRSRVVIDLDRLEIVAPGTAGPLPA